MQFDYRLSASLLDACQWWQSSEREYADEDLLESLNGAFTGNDSTARGNAFEELVCQVADGGDIPLEPSVHDKPCKAGLIFEFAKRIKGGVFQVPVDGLIETSKGVVYLKGYIDVLNRDVIQDIKYTAKYTTAKYKDKYQKDVYPLLLDMQGVKTSVMQYLVSDLKEIYSEDYPVNIERSRGRVVEQCEVLINFIEANRDKVSNYRLGSAA